MILTTGEFIAEKRSAAQLSQGALAEKVGATRVSVSRWERDINKPSARQVINLAAVFGCTSDEILRLGTASE